MPIILPVTLLNTQGQKSAPCAANNATLLSMKIKRCCSMNSVFHHLIQSSHPLSCKERHRILTMCTCQTFEGRAALAKFVALAPKDTAIEVYAEVPTYGMPRWRLGDSQVAPVGCVLLRG